MIKSDVQPSAVLDAGEAGGPVFALLSESHRLSAAGILRTLPSGPVASLAERVSKFFGGLEVGPPLLVGALPFDPAAPDFIFQPVVASPTDIRENAGRWAPGRWRVRAEPNRSNFRETVERAIALMRAEQGLSKVVLSRSLVLEADRAIDPIALAARLEADTGAVSFVTPLRNGAALVGATPELLIEKKGAAIVSHPLAGSARRSADGAQDRAAAEGLDRSEKDHREHALVVEAILDILAPYCVALSVAPERLHATRTMWHLGTRIEGRLKDAGVSSAELAAALHPTPAVGGFPRDAALRAIADLESYDRGFYAGAVGWTDAQGDGAWHVSLRCAEVRGNRLRLYAGAGIVPGSEPDAEVDETSAKFQTLLRAIGVDEYGEPLAGKGA